jgi:hypothetical protein
MPYELKLYRQAAQNVFSPELSRPDIIPQYFTLDNQAIYLFTLRSP